MSTEVRFYTWCDWHEIDQASGDTPKLPVGWDSWPYPLPTAPSQVQAVTFQGTRNGGEPLSDDLCSECEVKMPVAQQMVLREWLQRRPESQAAPPQRTRSSQYMPPYDLTEDERFQCPLCSKSLLSENRVIRHLGVVHHIHLEV